MILRLGHSPALSESLEIGASLAVSGVCLTLTEMAPGLSVVELSPETLARTTLGELEAGARVNLEPALRAGDALGGHWVQGHVDGVLAVVERRDLDGHRELAFELPEEHAAHVVEKGSVTLDGVSLTVSRLCEPASTVRPPSTDHPSSTGHPDPRSAPSFEVALIPHTLEVTTLDRLEAGDRVHFEVDILAKYVQRALATSGALAT